MLTNVNGGGVKRSFTSALNVDIQRCFRPFAAGSAAFFVLLAVGLLPSSCGPSYPLDDPDEDGAAADTCAVDTASGGVNGTIDSWDDTVYYDTGMRPLE